MSSFFKIGSNQRERNTCAAIRNDPRPQRVDFLYSYDTPVVVYIREENAAFVTSYNWSVTTSRHIRQWLSRFDSTTTVTRCPQATLDTIHHRANLWEAEQAGVTS